MTRPLTELTVVSSVARTTDHTSADFTNPAFSGGIFTVAVTTKESATPTLTVKVQGKAPHSTRYYTILTSTPLSSTGLHVLRVFPGASTSANKVANDVLPHTWRVTSTQANSTKNMKWGLTALLVP